MGDNGGRFGFYNTRLHHTFGPARVLGHSLSNRSFNQVIYTKYLVIHSSLLTKLNSLAPWYKASRLRLSDPTPDDPT